MRGRGQVNVSCLCHQKWFLFSESGAKITLEGQVLAGLVEVSGSRSNCVGGTSSRSVGGRIKKQVYFSVPIAEITLVTKFWLFPFKLCFEVKSRGRGRLRSTMGRIKLWIFFLKPQVKIILRNSVWAGHV